MINDSLWNGLILSSVACVEQVLGLGRPSVYCSEHGSMERCMALGAPGRTYAAASRTGMRWQALAVMD